MKRIGWYGRGRLPRLYSFILGITLAGIAAGMLSCTKPLEQPQQPKPAPSRPSDIKVEVRDGGPVVLTTSTAEFQILPSGFLQATLLKDGKRLTLDEAEVGSAGGSEWRFQRVRWHRRGWPSSACWWWKRMTIFPTSPWSAQPTKMSEPRIF